MVICGMCENELNETRGSSFTDRTPCPFCGSTSRMFTQETGGTLTVRSKLQVKARHPGPGRPFVEVLRGDELHRKTGKWMELERLIDRARNWYREVVID